MLANPVVPVDRVRAEQFLLLGSACRLFDHFRLRNDAQGIVWAMKRIGSIGFGFTWLGPGWIFDEYAAQRWQDELQQKREEMALASRAQNRRELQRVRDLLIFSKHTERLLWFIHNALWSQRRSVLRFPDYQLSRVVWGHDSKRPSHWRRDLLRLLKGLSWLHLAAWPDDDPPPMGLATALITHAGDLRGDPSDVCGEDCPGQLGPRHHHYLVNVGRGFLGALEQFAHADEDAGERTYCFVRGGPRTRGPSLWRAGKSGQLVPVFLPAKLGAPNACNAFTEKQHRLLQAIVRETTRAKKVRSADAAETAVFAGNLIPNFHGNDSTRCPFLEVGGQYVCFAGNGKRRALGYRLTSEGGWLAKGGYPLTDVGALLEDLSALASPLGLIVVGISRRGECFDLRQMRGLAATGSGRQALALLHVRIYTNADYLQRWTEHFQGDLRELLPQQAQRPDEAIVKLHADLASRGNSRRALARGLGIDHSFLNKVLTGSKPCPKGLLKKASAWVAKQGHTRSATPSTSRKKAARSENLLDIALCMLDRGWSVVPQLPGEKKPCVKWKPFQEVRPTPQYLAAWFKKWPNAGLALVLGPVSEVLVVDVDGPEAHAALCERLGREPIAPKAISGSRKPHRYHLFFKHPNVSTKAKSTPWHPSLEFRGQGGIVVIPPSRHKSGNQYTWADGKSPDDLPLPEVPPEILRALQPVPSERKAKQGHLLANAVPFGIDASPRTMAFLSGKYADGPRWNERLFSAACDLCARGLPLEQAEPLLLNGACPWNRGEEEQARRTISSAFAKPREPARL